MTKTWVLDLDNTLYPPGSGFFAHVNARIDAYMGDRLGIPAAAIQELRGTYRERFGITLGGLIAEHQVDPEDYLAYVHDVPLDQYLAADPLLAVTLERLPGSKVIFTNGSTAHAQAVLRRLSIDDQIKGIYDIAFMDYVPKPFVHGYRKLLSDLNVEAEECWMVDDLVANLDTGRELGMVTVLMGPDPQPPHLHVSEPTGLLELVVDYASLDERPTLNSQHS